MTEVSQDLVTPTDLLNIRQRQLHAIKAMASRFQQANKSDPFAYNRVATHLLLGVGNLTNYKCDFKTEYRLTPKGERYAIQVPCNMTRGA